MVVAKLSSYQVVYADRSGDEKGNVPAVTISRVLFGILRSSLDFDDVATMGIVHIAPEPDGDGHLFAYKVLFAVSHKGILYRISGSRDLLGGSVRQMRAIRDAFHCSGRSPGEVENVMCPAEEPAELHAICVKKRGRFLWGYADQHGAIRIRPQFRTAWGFRNGFAIVEKWSGWGCIDSRGEYLLKCLWRQMEYLGDNRVECWLGREGGWLSVCRIFEIAPEESCPVKAVRSSPLEGLINRSHKCSNHHTVWDGHVDSDALLHRLETRLQMKCSWPEKKP